MEFIMDKFRKNKETKEDIISIYMVPLEDGVPAMAVETKDEIYTEKLTEGYLIHQCNEFLRSLNLGINIEFNTYVEYNRLLADVTTLLNNEKHLKTIHQCNEVLKGFDFGTNLEIKSYSEFCTVLEDLNVLISIKRYLQDNEWNDNPYDVYRAMRTGSKNLIEDVKADVSMMDECIEMAIDRIDKGQKDMMDLNTLSEMVLELLADDFKARQSDDYLYYMICKTILQKNGHDIEQFTFSQLILSTNEYGLPKYETVSRARRKMQQTYPELKCSKKVEQAKNEKEEAFIEYALEQ